MIFSCVTYCPLLPLAYGRLNFISELLHTRMHLFTTVCLCECKHKTIVHCVDVWFVCFNSFVTIYFTFKMSSSTESAESPSTSSIDDGSVEVIRSTVRASIRNPGTPTRNIRKELFPSISNLQPQASTSKFSPPKKRRKKCPLSIAEKNIILNIYKTEINIHPEASVSDVVEKTSLAAGVSVASVYRILSEYKLKHKLSSPKKEKKRIKLLDTIDDFDRTAIRRKVHQFFFQNQIPTIDKILKVVNDDPDIPNFKRTSFYKLIKCLNFKFVK